MLAKLLPHAYLVDNVDGEYVDINDSEPTDVEKTPTFLTWMSNEGTNLTMIFGPRTCKEAETLRVDRPATGLAPVKCLTLEITVPNRAEVVALKKKIMVSQEGAMFKKGDDMDVTLIPFMSPGRKSIRSS